MPGAANGAEALRDSREGERTKADTGPRPKVLAMGGSPWRPTLGKLPRPCHAVHLSVWLSDKAAPAETHPHRIRWPLPGEVPRVLSHHVESRRRRKPGLALERKGRPSPSSRASSRQDRISCALRKGTQGGPGRANLHFMPLPRVQVQVKEIVHSRLLGREGGRVRWGLRV